MKRNELILGSLMAGVLLFLVQCDIKRPSADSVETNTEKEPKQEIQLMPGQISSAAADSSIGMYNSIYGEEESPRVFTASLDCDEPCSEYSQELFLPRYFVVKASPFKSMLEFAQSNENELFASMNIKIIDEMPVDPAPAVTNLIFHYNRPNPDGSLDDPDNDTFLDFGNACPVDCDENPSAEGSNSEPITTAEAVARVNCYNCIYGPSQDGRFISNGTDSVLIAKYFSFNENDIGYLLNAMKGKDPEFFYVSMGVQPSKDAAGHSIPNQYQSDIIFHIEHPKQGGGVGGASDMYFDITLPCPEACTE